ncbi:MAG: Rieske 2Fe-2S domain-containing protein [Chthonomonadales bacterium]|nr:Rieske 2Fe-2S domain-containing protein [Chthonomonadales bacterium]
MRKVFHRVAAHDAVVPGTGIPVVAGGENDCVLFRTIEGAYHATGALCPHQNEPLDRGRLEGREVVCRRHHLRFDLASGACTNAGGFDLRTFEVRVESDGVYIGVWED